MLFHVTSICLKHLENSPGVSPTKLELLWFVLSLEKAWRLRLQELIPGVTDLPEQSGSDPSCSRTLSALDQRTSSAKPAG